MNAMQEFQRALGEIGHKHTKPPPELLSAVSELIEESAGAVSQVMGLPLGAAVAAQADHYAVVFAEAQRREFSTFENEAMWEGVLAQLQARRNSSGRAG